MTNEEILETTKKASQAAVAIYSSLEVPIGILPLVAGFQLMMFTESLGWIEEDLDELYKSLKEDFFTETNEKILDISEAIH